MARGRTSNPPVPAAFVGGGTGPTTQQPQQPPTQQPPPAAQVIMPTPTFINANRDPCLWRHMPEPVVAKLRSLRREDADARSVVRQIMTERDEVRNNRLADEARLRDLTGPDSPFGKLVGDDHPEVVSVKSRLERGKAELARLDALINARSEQRAPIARLLESVERYCSEHLSRPMDVALFNGPEPEPRKGETSAADSLERTRRRIRELDADLHAVRSAPWPSAQAKARARAEIERWAEFGRPNVVGMVESPDRKIDWRRPVSDEIVAGRLVTLHGDPSALLMFWVLKDRLVALVEAEIDACSDDASALDLTERSTRIAQIERDKLMIEYEEEHWVCAAAAAGLAVVRRPLADPRAVLGLGISNALPAPSSR